jgi:hypothetical protein
MGVVGRLKIEKSTYMHLSDLVTKARKIVFHRQPISMTGTGQEQRKRERKSARAKRQTGW